ncbi:hypothetical protein GN956_G23483 [Arapaima gigas]
MCHRKTVPLFYGKRIQDAGLRTVASQALVSTRNFPPSTGGEGVTAVAAAVAAAVLVLLFILILLFISITDSTSIMSRNCAVFHTVVLLPVAQDHLPLELAVWL